MARGCKVQATADPTAATVAGVRISHPDRLIYPAPPISKIGLARYYEDIEDWILPHVAGRPLTLVHVVQAARLLRDVLETLGLQSWVKTTGGRGLHVVVPVTPARPVAECLDFSRNVSSAIARTAPYLYTTAFAKRGRERSILIDYLRNNRTNTSVCAFSPRVRTGAPVSVPIAWDALGRVPIRWTLTTVRRRLSRLRTDPWAQYWTTRQQISEASIVAVRHSSR
jgi:DNA primase